MSTLAVSSMTSAGGSQTGTIGSGTGSQTVSDILTPSLSISTVTSIGSGGSTVAMPSSQASVTAGATTTNVASMQKVDLRKELLQGIAIALLGLAVYF